MDYQACGDAQLAALVRAGQGEAFAELSARYLGLIRAKAKLFEGASAPEKEDLWQEGLLGLYAAAISYQPGRGASFPTYAGVCVYNQMASAVRRHGSSGNRPLNESVPLEDAGEAAVEAGPEALLTGLVKASIDRRVISSDEQGELVELTNRSDIPFRGTVEGRSISLPAGKTIRTRLPARCTIKMKNCYTGNGQALEIAYPFQ